MIRAESGWLAADWPELADRVLAGTTLRYPGHSKAPFEANNLGEHVGDQASDVAENRQQLQGALALPQPLPWLTQVHGTEVIQDPEPGRDYRVDAAWTAQAGKPLVVMTADCLPVLLYDQSQQHIGIAHAGWRGLLEGVIENTVRAMGGASHAWLGPAIGPQHFEVGAEVREAFVQQHAVDAAHFATAERAGHWMADLYALARGRLERLGVGQIRGGVHCTYAEADRFFSHRRDAGQTGRMASVIMRR